MIDENNNNEYPNGMQDAVSYGKHSVKRKQKERKIRKQRKKLKRFQKFLRTITFILLVIGIYCFIRLSGWYLPKTTFSEPDGQVVEFVNNNIVSTQIMYDMLKPLGVPKTPIFLMRVGKIKHELFKIPMIKKIYVRRYGFPARIQIIVRERTPIALIKINLKEKPVAFATGDGVLVYNKNYYNLDCAKSALNILTKYQNLKELDVKKVEHLVKVAKAVETYSEEKVKYIDIRNPNDVYVRINSTNIRLGLLDSTVFERIKRIYTILPKIDEVNGQVKYVDISWDKVNYFKLK